jgi:ribosomal protein S27AE
MPIKEKICKSCHNSVLNFNDSNELYCIRCGGQEFVTHWVAAGEADIEETKEVVAALAMYRKQEGKLREPEVQSRETFKLKFNAFNAVIYNLNGQLKDRFRKKYGVKI